MRKRLMQRGSATQMLWSKLEATTSLHALCRGQPLSAEQWRILAQCEEKLGRAQSCIDGRWRRRSFAFWSVIHEVDSLLLLVMPEPMLLPHALEIAHRFDRKVKDPIQRKLWLGDDGRSGPLPAVVWSLGGRSGALDANLPIQPLGEKELRHCRYVLRGALELVNAQADQGFWQLSINVTIQIFSTLLLGVFLLTAFAFSPPLVAGWRDMLVPKALLFFSLAGAAGATVSNMLSRERFVVSTGATSRYFIYYLLVKPAIGAFAALLLILLEQSRMLLAVEVAGGGGMQPPAAGDCFPITVPYLRGVAPPATSAACPVTEAPASALVQIVVGSDTAAFFALATLAVAVGFSADRLLSSMMDRVLSRLWVQSEKMGTSESRPARAAGPPSSHPR